ncbi:DUF4810 domain-containing protein [Altererythrobacter sp. SALINAS58]|uniref:DUF4810 domain-containing protein n=1 Tax=Alteripontixanthobacter muriae TaxID=2705546 RepID=UPI0015767483|nr:DUF4810 domain-containing protein [Alteripontixanthobacter muriae]NTZ42888.1 DUF4810 domain-containing protein [Alteripontixanthobacter muriae]
MKWVPIIGAALMLSACASTNSLYEWGSYQPALVSYKKNADQAAFEKELRESIIKGEESNRVPPGMYAELGYLLYEQGKLPEAAEFFGKERDAYPESAALMNKLIAGTSGGTQGGAR